MSWQIFTETSVWKGELWFSQPDNCLPDYRSMQILCNSLQFHGIHFWSAHPHTMELFLKTRICCGHHLLYLLTFPTFSWHYLSSSKMHVMQDIVSDTGDKKWRGHGHQLTSTRCNEGPLSGPSSLSEKDKGEGRRVTCSWEINTRFPAWTRHIFVPFRKQKTKLGAYV